MQNYSNYLYFKIISIKNITIGQNIQNMEENHLEQGQRLKLLIKMLRQNQSSFAQSLGMTQPNISRMVSGEGKLSVELLNRITKTYKDVNLHWLLTGQGDMFIATQEPDISQVNDLLSEYVTDKGKGALENLEARLGRLEEAVRQIARHLGK